jgi:hypothetical protein
MRRDHVDADEANAALSSMPRDDIEAEGGASERKLGIFGGRSEFLNRLPLYCFVFLVLVSAAVDLPSQVVILARRLSFHHGTAPEHTDEDSNGGRMFQGSRRVRSMPSATATLPSVSGKPDGSPYPQPKSVRLLVGLPQNSPSTGNKGNRNLVDVDAAFKATLPKAYQPYVRQILPHVGVGLLVIPTNETAKNIINRLKSSPQFS